MNFDSSVSLKKATGRAKSDVANKLVSMFLHEISRKACAAGGSNVSSPTYLKAVVDSFGHRCLYCARDLEHDRATVEHLDGMNRFRAGLHIPGNVAMACKRCNNAKRQDDQKPRLLLANTGWESFLSHDGDRCIPSCKNCQYWLQVLPDADLRASKLKETISRIRKFQSPFVGFILWADAARPTIQRLAEDMYRTCQDFATSEIQRLSAQLNFDFTSLATKSINA